MISNKTQAQIFSCIALGAAYQVYRNELGAFPIILTAVSTIAATKKWYDVYHTTNVQHKPRRYKRAYKTDSPNPIELALRIAELRNRK